MTTAVGPERVPAPPKVIPNPRLAASWLDANGTVIESSTMPIKSNGSPVTITLPAPTPDFPDAPASIELKLTGVQ